MRKLLQCLCAFLAVSLLVAGNAMAGGTLRDLDISLAAKKTAIVGTEDITVTLRLTNKTDETIAVPRPQLPRSDIDTPLFTITGSDGKTVDYVGPLVKWNPKALKETIKFAPGASREYTVVLSRSYAFGNGTYTIEYTGSGLEALSKQKLSAPVTITVQGLNKSELERAPAATTTRGQTFAYCTAVQRGQVNTASKYALNYAKGAVNYFAARTAATATQRYRTWFGARSATRWATAKSHFTKIRSALINQTIRFDCSCTTDDYAYVYSNQPYKIYLCQTYWSAPTSGTDSKAGTIIHEMSHFDVLGGTEDYAYGQVDAKALAVRYPNRAVNNADSHEYFAENRPWQP